jgi:uncharacterized protein
MNPETATQPWIVEQRWDLTYSHTADAVAARFLATLRDEGRLVGIRCPECERVLAPPRPICDRDFCRTEGFVDLAMTGTLELFTIVYLAIEGLPEPPYVLAYVRPDGADTAIPGRVDGLDLSETGRVPEELRIGAQIDIEVKDERVGRITDLFFRLRS